MRASTATALLLLFACSAEKALPESTQKQGLRDTGPGREIMFVLDGSWRMGGICRLIYASDEIGAERSYDCDGVDEPWRAQVEGLAGQLGSVPVNGSLAIGVTIATAGEVMRDDVSERYSGPVLAIPMTRVSSVEVLARLRAEVLALEQPRYPARATCPGMFDHPGPCAATSGLAWGIQMGAAHLEAQSHEGATRELCVGGDLAWYWVGPEAVGGRALLGPPAGGLSLSQSLGVAFDASGVERFTFLHLDPEHPVRWVGRYRRVATLEGVAASDGPLRIELSAVTDRQPEPGAPFAVLETEVAAGEFAESIALGIQLAIEAAALDRIEVVAHGNHLLSDNGRPAADEGYPFLHIELEGVEGLSLRHSTIGNDDLHDLGEWRARAVDRLGDRVGRSSALHLFGDPESYGAGFARCLRPRVFAWRLEANQVIQDLENGIPLVEGKDTLVRAFMSLAEEPLPRGETPPGGLRTDFELEVVRCEGEACELLGAPTGEFRDYRVPYRLRRPEFPDRAARSMDEAQPTQRFLLEPEWLTGRLELRLYMPEGELTCVPPLRQHGPQRCATDIEFEPNPGPQPLAVTPFAFEAGEGVLPEQMLNSFRLTSKLYPLNVYNHGEGFEPHFELRPARQVQVRDPGVSAHIECPADEDCEPNLPAFAASALAYLDLSRLVECVGEDCGIGVAHGFYAPDPRILQGLSKAGIGRGVLIEQSNAFLPADGPHELGHALGRKHVPYCMSAGPGFGPCQEIYPTPLADFFLASPEGADPWLNEGFGPALGETTPEPRLWGLDLSRRWLLDPQRSWDFMSYCFTPGNNWWSSKFTYARLFEQSMAGGVSVGGNLERYLSRPHVPVTIDCVPGPSCVDCPGEARVTPIERIAHLLEVAHMRPVSEEEAEVVLSSAFTVEGEGYSALEPGRGPRFIIRDRDGSVLGEHGAAGGDSDINTDGGSDAAAIWTAAVPFYPEAASFELVHGGEVIHQVTASEHAPSLEVLEPLPQALWDQPSNPVELRIDDEDGDPVELLVQYSPDGARWMAVDGGVRAARFEVSTAGWPGSDEGRLRILASDGFHTTTVEVPIRVPDAPPEPWLFFPEPEQRFAGDQTIMLRGLAADAEDGALHPSTLEWRSDVDGALGLGSQNLRAAGLSLGPHTLTMRATDSAGQSREASVEIFVDPDTSGPSADLFLYPDAPSSVLPERVERFPFTLFSGGEVSAQEVSLTLELPEDAAFDGAEGADWDCAFEAPTLRCAYVGPALAPKTATELDLGLVFAERLQPYELELRPRLHSANDAEPSNDSAYLRVRVHSPEEDARIDRGGSNLVVVVTDPGELYVGDVGHYHVAIRNAGRPDYPGPFRARLDWPDVLEPVGFEGEGWRCELEPRTARCEHVAASLAGGEALPVLRISVLVTEAARALGVVARAEVEDADPSDDEQRVTSVAQAAPPTGPDLQITSGGTCSPISHERHGAFNLSFHCIPALPLRSSGLTFGCNHSQGRIFPEGCTSPLRVQGGTWSYSVDVKSVGTEAVPGPTTVEVTLPEGLRDSRLRRVAPWVCAHEGQQITCTLEHEALDPGRFLPLLNFVVWIDRAAAEVYNQATLANASDANAENNTWVDPEPTRIRQVFAPLPQPPADTELAVEVELLGALEVDAPGRARFTVSNGGASPIATAGIELQAPTAPFLGVVQAAQGEGWACTLRWSSAHCTYEGGVAALGAGETLPPLEVDFVAGPAPLLQMTVAGRAREPGSEWARGALEAAVASGDRPEGGEILLSACPPYAECGSASLLPSSDEAVPRTRLFLATTDGRRRDAVQIPTRDPG